jgi:hypothetical protein
MAISTLWPKPPRWPIRGVLDQELHHRDEVKDLLLASLPLR